MRLPKGTLKKISEATGYSTRDLSNIISRRSSISKSKAIKIEDGCKKAGFINISKELLVFGSSEDIKKALIHNKYEQ